MTNPPEQVWKAPEGYEWTGEIREPEPGEFYATWDRCQWLAGKQINHTGLLRPILRRAKAKTLDLKDVPRRVVDSVIANYQRGGTYSPASLDLSGFPAAELYNACRAALEKEANSDQ